MELISPILGGGSHRDFTLSGDYSEFGKRLSWTDDCAGRNS
jgi:hypothetical protein